MMMRRGRRRRGRSHHETKGQAENEDRLGNKNSAHSFLPSLPVRKIIKLYLDHQVEKSF
jgi:hypothetical protein